MDNFRHIGMTGLALGLGLLLSACDSSEEPPTSPTTTVEPITTAPDPALAQATEDTWALGSDYLQASLARTTELADAVEQLLANPDAERLALARQAWHRSHQAYQTMAVLLAAGNSNPGLFGQLQQRDFLIDAWPIQPGFIDYYDVYSHSGIVNDIAVPLTADALREQHGITDESDVSLGYHALEYLLWGENGERPADDFAAVSQLTPSQEMAGLRVVDLPHNRRRTLLELLTALLKDDLASLQQAWNDPNQGVRRFYVPLHPQSRVELWHSAIADWATTTRSRLQSLIDNSAADNRGEDLLGVHNPFAGQNPQSLARQLTGLVDLLNLLGDNWQADAALADTLAQATKLSESLTNWQTDWPPTPEQAQALLQLLESLGESDPTREL